MALGVIMVWIWDKSRRERGLLLAAWGVVVVVGIGWLVTIGDYGITWDERVQSIYGELALKYFATGGREGEVNDFLNLRFYGPPFEMLTALAYSVTGWDKFLVRHVFSALAGVAALAGVVMYARLWRLGWLPLLSVLALAMLPRFYGHAPFNSKDIPFAAAFTWGMVAIGWLLTRERPRWRDFLVCGVAVGGALALRMGALLLPAFLVAGGCFRLAQDGRLARGQWRVPGLRRLAVQVVAMGLVAWVVMVLPWPWAHENPIVHPWQAFRLSTGFSSAYMVMFGGSPILSSELPRHYLPWMLGITTPVAHLVLLIGGVVGALVVLRRDWRSRQALLVALTVLWLCFPIGYVMLTRPNIYDGIRHFLFVLPALAVLAGAAGALSAEGLGKRWARWAAVSLTVVALILPVVSLVRLHPYQMTYYNALVGGVRGAWRSYETDYWSSSYKEAMGWINAQAAESEAPLRVLVAANRNNVVTASHFAGAGVELHSFWPGSGEEYPEGFDYYVALNRYNLPGYFAELPVVHTIGREGAVFTLIRRGQRADSQGR